MESWVVIDDIIQNISSLPSPGTEILFKFGLPRIFKLSDLRDVRVGIIYKMIVRLEKIFNCTYFELKDIELSVKMNGIKTDNYLLVTLREALLTVNRNIDYFVERFCERNGKEFTKSNLATKMAYDELRYVLEFEFWYEHATVDSLEEEHANNNLPRRSSRYRKQTQFYYGF
jgi:hypothetical protein